MQNRKLLIALLLALFFAACWGLFRFSCGYSFIVNTMLMLLFVYFLSRSDTAREYGKENKFFLAYVCAIIMNVTASYVNRGQTAVELVTNSKEFLNLLYFLSFYVFCGIGLTNQSLESILKTLYVTFIVAYMLQFFVFFPHEVFKMLVSGSDNFGYRRFRMIGQLICFLGTFYYMNRLFISRGKMMTNIVWMLLGVFIIFLLGFRTHLVAVVAAAAWMFFRTRGFNKNILLYIPLLLLAGYFIMQTSTVENVMEKMKERNENQNFSNENYIRVRQFNYFTKEHFINTSDFIFGSGIPVSKSEYGQYMLSRNIYNKEGNFSGSVMQWRDWGMLGLSWVGGIPLFCVLMAYMLYMIIRRPSREYAYISAFYMELLLSSFTTTEFYREGAFVTHALLMLIMHNLNQERDKARKQTRIDKYKAALAQLPH